MKGYLLLRVEDYAEALKLVSKIRASPTLAAACSGNRVDLVSIEASALFFKQEPNAAQAVINAALKEDPKNEALLAAANQVYLRFQSYTNALDVLNQLLELRPNAPELLCSKGYICLQLNAYAEALAPLTRALAMESKISQDTRYSALLNRAIAYLRTDKLDEAEADYKILQKAFQDAYQIYYGLGEIAFRRRDSNAAIRYYNLYLAKAPTNSVETKEITVRLKELQPAP